MLTDRPTVRVKRMADEVISVVGLAEPVISANDNLVQVNYQVFITDKAKSTIHTFQESHHMRYLFKPELDRFLAEAGFQHVEFGEWLTQQGTGVCHLERVLRGQVMKKIGLFYVNRLHVGGFDSITFQCLRRLLLFPKKNMRL